MFNIAIDGPSASGKSTIAKALAKMLNFTHIDTGAMYRAIAYDCIKKDIDLDNEEACSKLAQETEIELLGEGQVFLNGTNVTYAIRSEEISKAASQISKYKAVREKLVQLQQQIAAKKGYVMDGRDITSVVLPDAEIKIFQNADASVRAKRRFYEQAEKGLDVDYQEIFDDLVERDAQDINRSESPLIKVDDAIEIDTTYLTIDESVELIKSIIKDRGLL